MAGRSVVIVGEIFYSDLGIGGGPIYPSPQPPQPGYPSHPWVPPGGSPSHPWVPPGGYPSHPWVPPPGAPDQGLPGQPPGFWGGVRPPWLDNTLPGQPGQPPGFWGGNAPWPGYATPPIFIPPGSPPVDPPEDQTKIEWKTGWTADKGWVTVGVIVTDKPIPTPSS